MIRKNDPSPLLESSPVPPSFSRARPGRRLVPIAAALLATLSASRGMDKMDARARESELRPLVGYASLRDRPSRLTTRRSAWTLTGTKGAP